MLNIYAPMNTLGYGVHALNWIDALHRAGTELGIRPLGHISIDNSVYAKIVKDVVLKSPVRDFDAPTVVLWHQHDLARYRGTPLVGYTVFETSQLPPEQVFELSQLDAVFVPSHWARDVLIQSDELKNASIYVVPEGVNPTVYSPTPTADENGFAPILRKLIDNRYTILSAGKYEMRKGSEIVLDLLCNKLKNGITPICLIAMWDNPFVQGMTERIVSSLSEPGHGFFPDKELIQETGLLVFNSLSGDHRVIMIPRAFSELELADIYKLTDLAIFPYCAEGWNLPLIEALACGTRCVATNYSGPTEYLPDTDTILIEDYTMETADDGHWFRGNVGEWAVVDHEKLYDLVSPVILEGKGIRNTCAQTVLDKWSWNNAAQVSLEALKRIG